MDVPSSRRLVPVPRKLTNYFVLAICAGLLLHVFCVEPFEVPTGSMAPALLGHHRSCTCPGCGFNVVVGRRSADEDGTADRMYRSLVCPNCGTGDLGLESKAEVPGDRILVNKSVFAFRRPRRFEVVVFRRNGKLYIKRVLGLPGEVIEIRDGDVYIGGELVRKTIEQFRETRVLLRSLTLPARSETEKSGVLTSEYTYNGGSAFRPETVHDFCMECEVGIGKGEGTLRLVLTDGHDEAYAQFPVGRAGSLALRTGPVNCFGGFDHPGVPLPGLEHARTYKLELAFVDRRLTVAIDGKTVGVPVDLPPVSRRKGVDRAFSFDACGCDVAFKSVKLYRDLHYTQSGTNAVGGKAVRLGVDQYFVLGDNSGNSEDSRFWPAKGAIHERDLVGKPFLVYLPSRSVNWTLFGQSGETRLPDLARIRWLR